MAFGRSLMYSKKSNGPSFEPWATPHEMGRSDEFTPLMLTNCCRLRREWINLLAGPRMP